MKDVFDFFDGELNDELINKILNDETMLGSMSASEDSILNTLSDEDDKKLRRERVTHFKESFNDGKAMEYLVTLDPYDRCGLEVDMDLVDRDDLSFTEKKYLKVIEDSIDLDFSIESIEDDNTPKSFGKVIDFNSNKKMN